MTTTQTRQSFITSINKSINKAKVYGKLDLKILALYEMYIYYIDFTDGYEIFNDINKDLKIKASKLKYKYPDIICNYKLKINTFNSNNRTENTAPTVDSIVIDLDGTYSYNFTIDDFTTNYFDAEQDPYYKLTVYPNENGQGTLYFNGIEQTAPFEINVNEANNIRYVYIVNLLTTSSGFTNPNIDEVDYLLSFKISDISPISSLYSSIETIQILNNNYQENLPPEIGDISVGADNRVTTTLTLDMFTNQMQPPYSDPENDLIDAIRIDNISTTNQGVFEFNNNPIQVGDIITREDLENDLFKHIGPDLNTIATDSIEFSARDEGSQQWVQ